MDIIPDPKQDTVSTGKPDRRQRDNKQTPGNTPSLTQLCPPPNFF